MKPAVYLSESLYSWEPSPDERVTFDELNERVIHQTEGGFFAVDIAKEGIARDGLFVKFRRGGLARSIKFSPEGSYFAYLLDDRTMGIVDVLHPDRVEVRVPLRSPSGSSSGGKDFKALSFFWLPPLPSGAPASPSASVWGALDLRGGAQGDVGESADLVVVSTQGLEVWRFVYDSLTVKSVKKLPTPVRACWHDCNAGVALAAVGPRTLQPFLFQSAKHPLKLPKLDLHLSRPGAKLQTDDVAVMTLYEWTFGVHADAHTGRVSLRSLAGPRPADIQIEIDASLPEVLEIETAADDEEGAEAGEGEGGKEKSPSGRQSSGTPPGHPPGGVSLETPSSSSSSSSASASTRVTGQEGQRGKNGGNGKKTKRNEGPVTGPMRLSKWDNLLIVHRTDRRLSLAFDIKEGRTLHTVFEPCEMGIASDMHDNGQTGSEDENDFGMPKPDPYLPSWSHCNSEVLIDWEGGGVYRVEVDLDVVMRELAPFSKLELLKILLRRADCKERTLNLLRACVEDMGSEDELAAIFSVVNFVYRTAIEKVPRRLAVTQQQKGAKGKGGPQRATVSLETLMKFVGSQSLITEKDFAQSVLFPVLRKVLQAVQNAHAPPGPGPPPSRDICDVGSLPPSLDLGEDSTHRGIAEGGQRSPISGSGGPRRPPPSDTPSLLDLAYARRGLTLPPDDELPPVWTGDLPLPPLVPEREKEREAKRSSGGRSKEQQRKRRPLSERLADDDPRAAAFFMFAVLEYTHSLLSLQILPHRVLQTLVFDAAVFFGEESLLQQLLQYHVLLDSAEIAKRLVGFWRRTGAAWAAQSCLDMAMRIRDWSLVVEVLIRKKEYLQVVPFLRKTGASSFPMESFLKALSQDVKAQEYDVMLLPHVLESVAAWRRDHRRLPEVVPPPNLKGCGRWLPEIRGSDEDLLAPGESRPPAPPLPPAAAAASAGSGSQQQAPPPPASLGSEREDRNTAATRAKGVDKKRPSPLQETPPDGQQINRSNESITQSSSSELLPSEKSPSSASPAAAAAAASAVGRADAILSPSPFSSSSSSSSPSSSPHSSSKFPPTESEIETGGEIQKANMGAEDTPQHLGGEDEDGQMGPQSYQVAFRHAPAPRQQKGMGGGGEEGTEADVQASLLPSVSQLHFDPSSSSAQKTHEASPFSGVKADRGGKAEGDKGGVWRESAAGASSSSLLSSQGGASRGGGGGGHSRRESYQPLFVGRKDLEEMVEEEEEKRNLDLGADGAPSVSACQMTKEKTEGAGVASPVENSEAALHGGLEALLGEMEEKTGGNEKNGMDSEGAGMVGLRMDLAVEGGKEEEAETGEAETPVGGEMHVRALAFWDSSTEAQKNKEAKGGGVDPLDSLLLNSVDSGFGNLESSGAHCQSVFGRVSEHEGEGEGPLTDEAPEDKSEPGVDVGLGGDVVDGDLERPQCEPGSADTASGEAETGGMDTLQNPLEVNSKPPHENSLWGDQLSDEHVDWDA
uniref:Mic1 domain-containing protein n=1 Tax=Chromera velia CCMP2878 TaxID=1169474 RepID=A0A0G4HTP7_9ALVE|eukprot:Cvel_1357.t1-p1 / transcript=Cvel_1357.t1 / gene=Cvel_1357 / organism=Chromera_velia_CCMP2878 / gene_product=hypothetical protein / transcript_product=hypothetical protein / location=Cvel_scaffold46:136063-147310(+) / protein_length=1471 / sequence_SO=supercontig / SO=protein_coding / is_pseudo=false